MSQIKLITFDATNTLFKVCGSVGGIYVNTAYKYGIKADPEKIENNFKKAFKQSNSEYPNFGQTVGMLSHKWWNGVIGTSFDGEIKSDLLDKISSDLYDNFMKKSHWELFPDVLPTLEHFRNKGTKLGVLSNFDERLSTIITELDINKYFTFVLASRNTEWYKPSPQIFHHAASLVARCSTVEVTHIGDNLELDYKAARNAGMDAYLLSRQPSDTKIKNLITKDVPQHKIITNLQQLCNLI
jgi:REG-2-like HAD superfamily hydrolase